MAGRSPSRAAMDRSGFAALLADVKRRSQTAQTRAVLAVNSELVRLYWDIGRIIAPEYAGKLNFYCNVVNDRLKHPTDAPMIGLILCQTRDHLLAEYSFAGIDKPIGISTYGLTRALPARLRSALPTVEEIEAALSADLKPKSRTRGRKS